MELNEYCKNKLKEKIQERYGKQINIYQECDQLSDHIYKCINEYISPQTIRRFFDFIKDGTKPSKYTISLFLKYCGFANLDDLSANCHDQQLKLDENISLIKQFYSIDLCGNEDFNYQNACGNIAKMILSEPKLLYALEGFLCKNPTAQIFFFERHPYVDGLGSDYIRILKNYSIEKKTNEAQLFSLCLQHLSCFLTNNWVVADQIIEQINNIEFNYKIHPFVQARRLMSNLTNAYMRSDKLLIDKWTVIAYKEELKQLRHPQKEAYFPFFQFILADTFNQIERHKDALELINIAEKEYRKQSNSPIEEGYYQSLDLIKAIALFNTGHLTESKEILKNLSINSYIFSCQKYFYIQQLHLKLKMISSESVNKKVKIKEEINELVRITGFTRFSV